MPPPLIDQIEDFDWLPETVEKIIEKHSVQPEEVEQCFDTSEYKLLRTRNQSYQLLSRSYGGRYLTIIFAWKKNLIRIITARDMDSKERVIYRRK